MPAAAGIMVITSPAAVTGATNATHASTDWKLTSDPEGVFAIALDEASPDLVTHTFTGLNLAAGQTYYVWARHNATPVGYGPWARAAVYVS